MRLLRSLLKLLGILLLIAVIAVGGLLDIYPQRSICRTAWKRWA